MKKSTTKIIFALILVVCSTFTGQAFSCRAPLRTFGTLLLRKGGIVPTPLMPSTWSKHPRDVSLAFFNRDAKKASKSIEEDANPPKPVILDKFPPDVEHSRPSVDQDAKWMEQEATTEVLSVFAVFALLALLQSVLQNLHS